MDATNFKVGKIEMVIDFLDIKAKIGGHINWQLFLMVEILLVNVCAILVIMFGVSILNTYG